MTTINNLIIEQMREIVSGAPEHTQVCIPCLEDVVYFAKRDDGKWFKWSNGYNQWLEYFGKVNPMDLALDLNDLRSAIAKHDEDHCNHEWNDMTSNGDKYRSLVCKHCDSTKNYLPLDEDHVTDIRNHVSPNTRVVDL